MNILYCGDKNIEDGLYISIKSILKHTNEVLNIYVLTMKFVDYKPVSDKVISELDLIVKNINNESFVKKIDITDIYNKNVPRANVETRFTPYCMLRLYADLIPLPSKILYLDNDVVCNNNFIDFYNMDNSEYELIGVLDHYGSHFFRRKILKKDYLNSGVLLINLDLIKKTKLFEKARIMCSNKKMLLPDQSALNKLSEKKYILPRKYNEQKETHDDTIFRHFSTTFRFFPYIRKQTIKPWHLDNLHNILNEYRFDDILEDYIIWKENRNNE